MRKGVGFQSHNIFDVLEATQNKKTKNNNESDEDEEPSYYCLEFSGLPLYVEKTQFLPTASSFGPATHIDCDKSGYAYAFYEQKHVATKTLMSASGKRYQGKRMAVQFAPNKVLPVIKKCYHCDKLGHFGIDCAEGPCASMPEEIIGLFCSFVNSFNYDTAPMKVNKKWKRAIQTHTNYLRVTTRWSPLLDKFANLSTLFVYNITPGSLKNFPKLQTLVTDIGVMNNLTEEFPLTLKNIKIVPKSQNRIPIPCALPQTWTQRAELAGLESLSFSEYIPDLPFTFKDVTHLTNLKRLNLPSFESPKEHLTSLAHLEHLGCAVRDDLTPFDTKILTRLTSFEALRYRKLDMDNDPLHITSASYTWLSDLTGQMKAISLRAIEHDFNFKVWPNLQSLSIEEVLELPETMDQLNPTLLTELNLTMGTTGLITKLGEFTNLVKLKIDVETASNGIFLQIIKLTNLRHLEFSARAVFPAVDGNAVGLSKMPNLEYLSLHVSVDGLEDALFIDEICELPALKSIFITINQNPRFMKVIPRFNKVNEIRIFGTEQIHNHHAIALRHKMKGPEYMSFNGINIDTITTCSCEECHEKNHANSLDHYAVDPAPAVLEMEDHMLDAYEIRDARGIEHEKKVKKHDKTKMQRLEKQGNLSEKEMRKKRNRRK